MAHKLTREAFRKLIAEDIAYLEALPRTLERDHIIMALKESEQFHYDLSHLLDLVRREAEGLSPATWASLLDWIKRLAGSRGD